MRKQVWPFDHRLELLHRQGQRGSTNRIDSLLTRNDITGLAQATHSLLTTVSVACRVVFFRASDSVSAATVAIGADDEIASLHLSGNGDDGTCAFC
jgi:hypothetical protein